MYLKIEFSFTLASNKQPYYINCISSDKNIRSPHNNTHIIGRYSH